MQTDRIAQVHEGVDIDKGNRLSLVLADTAKPGHCSSLAHLLFKRVMLFQKAPIKHKQESVYLMRTKYMFPNSKVCNKRKLKSNFNSYLHLI